MYDYSQHPEASLLYIIMVITDTTGIKVHLTSSEKQKNNLKDQSDKLQISMQHVNFPLLS